MPTPKPSGVDESAILNDDKPVTAEDLKSALDARDKKVEENALRLVHDLFKEKSKPNTDTIPSPDLKPSGVKITGHASDVLYAGLKDWEKPYRNRHSDALCVRWLGSMIEGDVSERKRLSREINDLYLANEITVGTADSNGGIGSGTGADLLPVPIANLIVTTRARVAKIRPRARVISVPPGAGQSIRVPRFGGMTAEVVTESNSVANSGDDWSSIILSLKKFQVKGTITREMLRFTPFSVLTDLTRDGGARFGELEDREFCTPRGQAASISRSIEKVQGHNSVTPKTAGRVTYADMVALRYAALEQYRANQTILANSQGLQLLSSVLDGNGRNVFTPYGGAALPIGDGQLPGFQGMVMGLPVIEAPLTISGVQENLASIWAVDLSEYLIADGGNIEVRVSEHVKFEQGQVMLIMEAYLDGSPADGRAYSELTALSGTNNGSSNDLIFS